MPADLKGAADLLEQLIPSDQDTPAVDNSVDDTHDAATGGDSPKPVETSVAKSVDQRLEERVTAALAEMNDPAPVEKTAPVAATPDPVTAQVAEPAKPTAAELRVAEMQERLARLKADRAAKASQVTLDAERAALKAERERAQKLVADNEAAERAWKESLKDPIAAYRRLGVNPAEAYDKISTAAERANSPEAKAEAERERLREEIAKQFESKFAELEKTRAELEELKQARLQENNFRAQSAQRAAEQDFLKIVGKSGNEVLADYYDDNELVQLGHDMANEFIADKRQFTLDDVVSELRTRLETQLKRAEERRTRRSASNPNGATPISAPAEKPAGTAASKQAETITNTMASSVATSVPKRLTPEQRRREAAQMLGQMLG